MITVQRITELDLFHKQMQLLGGKKGLNKEVNFITIMEAPDFYEWVSGGEFVLTSWYAYSQNPTNQEYAFRQLAMRVSAIAIKINRFLDTIPEEFIKIADECNVPLFSLKRETKFREVIQAVAGEVQNAQANILQEVGSHYQDLMKEALATDNLSALLQSTGKRTGLSCFCLSFDGKLQGHWLGAKETTVTLNEKIRSYKELHKDQKPTLEEYSLEQFRAFPCTARKQLLGILVLISPEELSERSHLMAQQTASMLSLKLLEGYETRQKQLNRLLADIISDNVKEEQLAALGLNLTQGFYSIAVLTGKGEKATGHLEEAAKQVRSVEGTQLVMPNGNELILIGSFYSKDKSMPTYLSLLKDWLEKKKYPLAMVQGTLVDKVPQLGESLKLARKSAQAALQMNATGWQEQKDWLISSLVLNQLDSPETKQLKNQILQPLQEYDRKHHADLMQTLKTVMESPKLEVAAENLHVHVNTLRYRLGKVKELTGYDPQNSKERIFLGIALMIHDLQK